MVVSEFTNLKMTEGFSTEKILAIGRLSVLSIFLLFTTFSKLKRTMYTYTPPDLTIYRHFDDFELQNYHIKGNTNYELILPRFGYEKFALQSLL